MRTEAERRDQRKSWERDDRAFFASGACHILAFTFLDEHPDPELEVVHITPTNRRDGRHIGEHVYVRHGEWAFDFNGWTPEALFLERTARACEDIQSDWSCELRVVTEDLSTWCRLTDHRPPADFHADPVARARRFLTTLRQAEARTRSGVSPVHLWNAR